jgi:hypothetical protein
MNNNNPTHEEAGLLTYHAAKTGCKLISLSKAEIDRLDFKKLEHLFDPTKIPIAELKSLKNKIMLNFVGFPSDKLDIFEVPELRRYFLELADKWPSHGYFQEEEVTQIPGIMLAAHAEPAWTTNTENGPVKFFTGGDLLIPALRFESAKAEVEALVLKSRVALN